MIIEFINSHTWALMLTIFCARILDVSCGTFRTLLIFRGYRLLAMIVGFFEVFIWIMAAGRVLTHLNEWYLAVSYACGFAVGNYVGMWIESKVAMGTELVRIVSENRDIQVATKLRGLGYKPIQMEGRAENEVTVEILLIVEKRRNMPKLLKLVKEIDPEAFYTVEDVKRVYEGADIEIQKEQASWLSTLKKK